METRLVTSQDLPILAKLHAESFTDSPWKEHQLRESLALKTTDAYIVSEKSVIQGFIFYQLAADQAEILTFCIAPRARRLGFGAYLLDTSMTSLARQDIRRVFLEVAATNGAALALYKKLSFHIIGKRTNYYRLKDSCVDAITLECSLS